MAEYSDKSRLLALLLCLILGGGRPAPLLRGKVGTGILMILTLGGLSPTSRRW